MFRCTFPVAAMDARAAAVESTRAALLNLAATVKTDIESISSTQATFAGDFKKVRMTPYNLM